MVIDLTRRPVFLNTDICLNSIVVRTSSNGEVDGRLRRQMEKSEHRRSRNERMAGAHLVELDVGATRVTPSRNIMESRLPLNHILLRHKDDPIPNPYEVATVYVDAFTQKTGTWRARISIEQAKNKNGSLWLITIRDEVAKIDLVTATVKELETERARGLTLGGHGPDDQLPLERMGARPTGKLSVWERLRLIEYGGSETDEDP